MPRDMIVAVLAGILGATMFLSSVGGAPSGKLLAMVSPLPLFVVGLGFGAGKAALAGLAGGVMLAALNSLTAVSFLVMDVLPAVFVARQGLKAWLRPDGTMEWMAPGRILGGLSVMAVAMLAVMAIQAPHHAQGLEGLIRDELHRQFAHNWPEGDEAAKAWAAVFAPVLPGAAMNTWVLRAIVLGVLAQWGLALIGHNRRPTPAYVDLTVPHWLVAAFTVVLGMTFGMPGDAGYIARNGALVLSFPLFLQGLAAVHSQARRTKAPSLVLGAFYVTYIMTTWGYFAVVGLGFVEHLLKLRLRRMAGGGSGREEK